MSIEQMRAILMKQYRGAYKWQSKVKQMSDKQIMAIYFRMLNAGKLSQ